MFFVESVGNCYCEKECLKIRQQLVYNNRVTVLGRVRNLQGVYYFVHNQEAPISEIRSQTNLWGWSHGSLTCGYAVSGRVA